MSNTTRRALVLCLSVLSGPAAFAQTTDAPQAPRQQKFFISANAGYQMLSETYESVRTFEAFDETATLSSSGELKSEPIYDVSVGYLINEQFGVSVGLSHYVTEHDVTVLASVPHPIFFDQVRTATYDAAGIKNSSPALHLNAVYFIPFTTDLSFSVSAGPSIVFVRQDVVTGATLRSENPPFTTPNIESIAVTAEKKTTIGFNAGADAVYSFGQKYGVGFGVRYLFASADVEGLADSVSVGGFQVLGGVRFKF